MKTIIFCLALIFCPVLAHAATAADDCQTGANDNAVGSVAWSGTSINDGCGSDNTDVSATVNSTAQTNYYKATNFDFSVIDDADTINGIQVDAEIATTTNGANNMDEARVSLIDDGGNIELTNRATATTDWPASDTVVSYGGTADLWDDNGESWTPAIVKSSNFGVAISGVGETTSGAKDVTGTIDNVAITITYTTAGRRRIISVTSNAGAYQNMDTRSNDPLADLGKIAVMHLFFVPFWFSFTRRKDGKNDG